MCRLSAFFGAPICAADLVTRPSRSIITQSFDARERMTGDASTPAYLNGDGFGLGWYSASPSDPLPCVYRQARPAWNDPNLSAIAEKVFTRVLFAHVRAASPGLDVSEGTCHPFRVGRYLWMHNGALGSFTKLRRRLLAGLNQRAFDFAVTHGSSDTALCFAIFLNLLDDHVTLQSPEVLRKCLESTISTLETAVREEADPATSLLNFVVSDGHSLVASRYVISISDPTAKAASLYYAAGNSYQSDGSAPGNYAMMHSDRRPSMTIISSEPLTESRSDWVSVPQNHCIVITKSMHILLAGISASPHSRPDEYVSRILVNLATVNLSCEGSTAKRKDAVASVTANSVRGRSALLRQCVKSASGAQLSSLASTANPGVSNSVLCPVGAAVRSTITIGKCVVLCSTVMGSLLCSGTNDGTVHVWDLEENRLVCLLKTGGNAVLSLLADVQSDVLICGTSASAIWLFQRTDEDRFLTKAVVCCEGMGDVLSLALLNRSVYAGFSNAALQCVVRDIDNRDLFRPVEKACEDGSDFRACENPVKINVAECWYEFPSARSPIVVHKGFIFALAVCLNGRFLCTGCGDGILRVWDVPRETCVQTRNDHAGAILALAVYEVPHGTMLFSGSRDCSVKVWVWDGDRGFICKRTLRKHDDEIVFLAVAGKKLVSGSADGALCVWCVETLKLICQYRDSSLKAGGVSAAFNSLFTSSEDGSIQVRDIISMERDLRRRDSYRNILAIDDVSSSSFPEPSLSERGHPDGVNGALLEKEYGESDLDGDEEDANTSSAIVSEVNDDSDDAETLVPGVTNEVVLAPPMSPLIRVNNGFAGDDESVTDLSLCGSGKPKYSPERHGDIHPHVFERRLMQDVLHKFISFATVADSTPHREFCWQGARYIGRFLEGMGASVKYVNTASRAGNREMREDIPSKLSNREARTLAMQSESNPIVLARFASADPNASTITFYGHYDVMPALDLTEWKSDPWLMTSVDGYFYGRGVTDNKGPIIAMVFAVKKLMEESANGLGVNVVLVLQGEGEASNVGFKDCITSHSYWFDRTCVILTSNSIWLGENRPCLTYGFRGIIDLCVTVSGGSRNLHSGVDGGAVLEPMIDLITILGTLVDSSGVVCIPGFYDDVRPLSEHEKERLQNVDFDVKEYHRGTGVDRFTVEGSAELLEHRWRKPSVSITSVESSNVSGFYSVVPRSASAKVSIRFVPDQDPGSIEQAVRAHLQYELRRRRSPNKLDVSCVNRGDWWLDDPSGEEFQIAARAVRSVWGMDADYVCEGGSMPLFSFLADALDAPVVQVPLGQSSDGAHLPNERIREMNLFKGKEVLQHILAEYAERATGGRLNKQQPLS